MPLLDQLQKDMVAAMKAKEELKLGTIRMVKAALMKEKVDSMKELDEAAEMRILNMLLKQRRESVEMYRLGGRDDQAVKEEAEIKIIEAYMPEMATDEEIGAAIDAAIAATNATVAKQMGLVMKAAQSHLAGKRVDGRSLSEKVKARLG
jgi:uncharacterized protein